MIINAEEIKQSIGLGEIIIDPFNEDLLKPGSYTFTLGGRLRKPKTVAFVDTRLKKIDFDEFQITEDGYLLQPGEFAICHTKEILRLSDTIACFLTMRGFAAQTGLDALGCEIFCEPGSEGGWNGKLMLGTSNRSPYPVKLFTGIKIIKGIFIRL